MEAPKRILIIKPSSLGDVATALPMVCDLRRALPEARIDWLVAPAFAALVRGHDAINEVILFDRKELGKGWRSLGALRKLRALNQRLKGAGYDCVIDAQGLFRSGYFARKAGAAVRIGFADAREGGKFFYTHRVGVRRKEALAVVRMRALLEPLGIATDGEVEYRVPIDVGAAEKMKAIVPEGAIGVIPGSRGSGKRWPGEGFAKVMGELAGERAVVVFGSPEEKALGEEIVGMSGTEGLPRVNLAGRTSVAEMVAALARCAVVVGNDTGPLHVAAALGKPVVGLYGKTDPKSVGPYGQLGNVVRFVPGEKWERRWAEVVGKVMGLLSPPTEQR